MKARILFWVAVVKGWLLQKVRHVLPKITAQKREAVSFYQDPCWMRWDAEVFFSERSQPSLCTVWV